MADTRVRLTGLFADLFSPTVRSQGATYFRAGCVDLAPDGGPGHVDARVRGSQLYDVEIFVDGREELVATCTCPHYASGDFCKHLWAVLEAADQEGRLESVRAMNDPEIFHEFDEMEFNEPPPPPPKPKSEPWRELVRVSRDPGKLLGFPKPQEPLVYWLDPKPMLSLQQVILTIGERRRKKDGTWSEPKPKALSIVEVERLADPTDRRVLASLLGAPKYTYWIHSERSSEFALTRNLMETLFPAIGATGRFFIRTPEATLTPLHWDDAGPWAARMTLKREENSWVLRAHFERGSDRLELTEVILILSDGFLFTRERVASFRFNGPFSWLSRLKRDGEIRVPLMEAREFRDSVLDLPERPPIDWPEELRIEELSPRLQPCLRLLKGKQDYCAPQSQRLHARLTFEYDGVPFESRDRRRHARKGPAIVLRDAKAEAGAIDQLGALGFRPPPMTDPENSDLILHPKFLPHAVRELMNAGWRVEAEQGLYKQPGEFRMEVVSGIDWFDLKGGVDFDGKTVPFPRILAALREGRGFVTLDDGSQGVLPEAWLRKMGLFLGAGETQDDRLRFRPGQAALLDALLAAEERSSCDATFGRIRERLRTFDGIGPCEPPVGFRGELRPYQKVGLGWMNALRDLGLGGCLADDMGLGKTVEVLALLESRRGNGPSLVVAPRSLVFNWKAEAARFAPALRVLDHTGAGRSADFRNVDVVLATYGTMRRDAPILKDVAFDYVILDESTAIKNGTSATAKASRLLKGRHKLALSGTPIENHLGELWSLFEFLNPGLLGRASLFKGGLDDAPRELLARALRPYILRRTKAQVAPELPEKLEQTIHCDLEPAERKEYDELREYYRLTLAAKISEKGLGAAKINVLEAILRLRQAACHPGLLDAKRRGESSTKLEMLLEQVREVIEEGHKALVFSQFTSLLGIVRARLDAEKIAYEYLDGETRDRGARVERFQTDPKCPLFLVSLKAGGFGLNLTAAEYVFLLDPWWNPAVEAQAIDRTHRIGQTRRVFGYRIVARGTIEEKVLELQKSKRELAESILRADDGFLRSLTREDLDLLLS